MTFFEQELRKIIGDAYPDATFVGRACYVPLSDLNRAKIQFTTCGIADHYEALQLTILNRNDGQIDTLRLRFAEVCGKKQVASQYSQHNGLYAWTSNGETSWYMYKPTATDYRKLHESIRNYLDVFHSREDRKPELVAAIHAAKFQVPEPNAHGDDKTCIRNTPPVPER